MDELLVMAEKVPDRTRRRVLERPDAFRKLARLGDEAGTDCFKTWMPHRRTPQKKAKGGGKKGMIG